MNASWWLWSSGVGYLMYAWSIYLDVKRRDTVDVSDIFILVLFGFVILIMGPVGVLFMLLVLGKQYSVYGKLDRIGDIVVWKRNTGGGL